MTCAMTFVGSPSSIGPRIVWPDERIRAKQGSHQIHSEPPTDDFVRPSSFHEVLL